MQLVKATVTNNQIVVLDASALDIIATDTSVIAHQAKKIIITPHQIEWQRLSNIRVQYQNDSANQTALNGLFPQKNCILVLKSNKTKIYDQFGNILENPLGNPGMATGGCGDTLSGIIGGICGQFGGELNAVASAVYLHSLAGDIIYRKNYIVRPTAISALLPQLLKKYEYNNNDVER